MYTFSNSVCLQELKFESGDIYIFLIVSRSHKKTKKQIKN